MNSYVERWNELCGRFLAVNADNSIWRYSRKPTDLDPEQGWKLHVGATLLTANRALELIGPVLSGSGVLFKGPCSLEELCRINSGIYYGYTQVGKCFTIYPANDEASVSLADELSKLLRGLDCPTIPFDNRYVQDSPIFYRYGSFKARPVDDDHGDKSFRDPDGNFVEDRRDTHEPPTWVTNPFSSPPVGKDESQQTNYRVVRAIRQRGKGGVYFAIDFGSHEPQVCILKEGRLHGEVAFDGRDGYWRIEQEKEVLQHLGRAGVPVPKVLSSFIANRNFYLVLEYIDGQTMEKLLSLKKRRLPIRQAVHFAAQVAEILSRLHATGYVWRDCKPANLIVVDNTQLRPIDFEGACKIGDPNPISWGTKYFEAPNRRLGDADSQPSSDVYSLGVTTHYLLTGQYPDADRTIPIQRLRKGIGVELETLVSDMLNPDAARRPSARSAAERLVRALQI